MSVMSATELKKYEEFLKSASKEKLIKIFSTTINSKLSATKANCPPSIMRIRTTRPTMITAVIRSNRGTKSTVNDLVALRNLLARRLITTSSPGNNCSKLSGKPDHMLAWRDIECLHRGFDAARWQLRRGRSWPIRPHRIRRAIFSGASEKRHA